MRTMYSKRYCFAKFYRRCVRIFIFTFLLSALIIWMLGMGELIDQIATNYLEYLVTDIINTSVYDCMKEFQFEFDDLVTMEKNEKTGKISSYSIEPYSANLIKSRIATIINSRINDITDDDMKITLGMLLGYCTLGSWGPEIPIAVAPSSNLEIDFSNEFVSVGVNQSQSNLYIDVDVKVCALMPFFKCESDIRSSVIVAQTIIVGDVPQFYINNRR